MKSIKFIYLLWQFNAMLDSGKYIYVSVDDIKKQIRNGNISEYLSNTFPDGDFSLMEKADWDYVSKEWAYYADDLDERRKMGIVNNGLCLLVGYTLNGLQLHADLERNKA